MVDSLADTENDNALMSAKEMIDMRNNVALNMCQGEMITNDYGISIINDVDGEKDNVPSRKGGDIQLDASHKMKSKGRQLEKMEEEKEKIN